VGIENWVPVKGIGILRANLSLFDTCIDIHYGFFACTENMDLLLLNWFLSQEHYILLILKKKMVAFYTWLKSNEERGRGMFGDLPRSLTLISDCGGPFFRSPSFSSSGK
jgi:hypothetical protein